MENKIKKLVTSLAVFALVIGLTTPTTINGDELEEPVVEEVEETEVEETETIEEETTEEEAIEETEEVEEEIVAEEPQVQTTSEVSRTSGIVALSSGVDTLVPGTTTLEAAFPDAIFRTYVGTTVLGNPSYDDSTGSGYILNSSDITTIEGRTAFTLNNLGIDSLEGIQHFTGLTSLRCNNNNLTELNVSSLINLEVLQCHSNQLTELDVSSLGGLELLYCQLNQITELDVSNLGSLETLYCHTNQLTKLDVSNAVSLTNLRCYTNQITELNVSNLVDLEYLDCGNNKISELDTVALDSLTALRIYMNPISEITISDSAKPSIYNISYRSTDIESIDLSGFSTLTSISITKSINADLSGIDSLVISGSRDWSDQLAVLVSADVGALSWDITTGTGYYVIDANSNGTYGFTMDTPNGNFININNVQNIEDGGLVDNEGNLIVGATLTDVEADGSITLDGATIVSPNGTYEFSGNVTIKDGVITTNEEYTFAKNTAEYDESTDSYVANVGSIVTTVTPSEDGATIDTVNYTTEVSAGSVVTNSDGDEIYAVDEAIMDDEGNISSAGTIVTVPDSLVNDITIDGSKHTLPAGSTVTIGGESTTYPGEIIINTDDNSVQYLPVDALFNEDGSLKDGVTQEDLDNAKDFVDGLEAGSLKDNLQVKVEEAQKQYDEKEAEKAVDDLFNPDGTIKESVTQEDIDNAKDLVNKVTDPDKKKELEDKLKDAQDQFNEREAQKNAEKAVDDLFNPDGTIKESVTQEDIDNAKDLVNKVTDPDKKKELEDKLKDAQDQLDEREAQKNAEKEAEKAVDGLFNPDGSGNIKDGLTQEDIDNAQDLVNKLPDGAKKDELQNKIDEAQKQYDRKEAENAAKDAVNDLFNPDGSGNIKDGLTQKEINDAQDLVNKLPNGELKDSLQASIDEAQKQLDELNANASKPSVAPPGQSANLSGTSTSTVSSVNAGDYTDTALLMGMMVVSIAVLGLFAKKRKEATK